LRNMKVTLSRKQEFSPAFLLLCGFQFVNFMHLTPIQAINLQVMKKAFSRMATYVGLIVVLGIAGCAATRETEADKNAILPDLLPRDSILSASRLQQDVQALSHDSMQGRLTGSSTIDLAADFVASRMKHIGLDTAAGMQGYFMYWQNKLVSGKNVLGVLKGKSDSVIIFTAHYDHVGKAGDLKNFPKGLEEGLQQKKVDDDIIYNGANDDASGVVAMLALAEWFVNNTQPHYTLVFAACSGEEFGLLGSNALAAISFSNLIVRDINLEMLGRSTGRPFITEAGKMLSLRKLLNENLKATGINFNYFRPDPYKQQNYFYRSDNFSFARRKIEANTIMATASDDPFYHSPDDEWQTLDYQGMSIIVKAIALSCKPLVEGHR